jgi:hypothetical protein
MRGSFRHLAENWNTLFQIDEIGRMLATMQSAGTSPHLYNISSVLMQIYSSADDIWQADAYGDRKKCKTLEYPHCVVYGSSVPDGFWTSLSKQNLSDGLIGRFLVFENSDYVDYQDVTEQPLPANVIERCQVVAGAQDAFGQSGRPNKLRGRESTADRVRRAGERKTEKTRD